MWFIHYLYTRLTGKVAPRDLPEEWKEPSRFQNASVTIVAALLAFAAGVHEWLPGALAPPSDVPNVEQWSLDVWLFWGAVSWATFSLIVFAMNRQWRRMLACLAWYAASGAVALGYFLVMY